MNLPNLPTPEEEELSRKHEIFLDLENKLLEKEVDLTILKSNLSDFQSKYLRYAGPKISQLENLKQRIFQLINEFSKKEEIVLPINDFINTEYGFWESATSDVESGISSNDPISEDIKVLFRKIAKCIHPDLSSDIKDRIVREELMKRANDALSRNDSDALLDILQDWERRPESIIGTDPGAILIRTIRKIAQINKRITEIDIETTNIKESDIYKLFIRADEFNQIGIDFFKSIINDIDSEMKKIMDNLLLLLK